MIRSIFINTLMFLVTYSTLSAQDDSSDTSAIRNVVYTMFEGMRLGDSAMVSQVFYREAQFFSAYMTKQGASILKEGSVQEWLHAIGTPHDNVWNEEWWDLSMKVDGNFAHAWVPYAFYVDDDFSHCGVDSLHMIKDDEGHWKIFHATDTRRRGGCEEFIPEHIRAKHQRDD